MLIRHFMIRKNDLFQVPFPQAQAVHFLPCPADPFRQLFTVFFIIIYDNLSHECRRLAPNVAFFVSQQLIKKIKSHSFLLLCHVGTVFIQNVNIGPYVLPLLFASGRFNQISEGCLIIKLVHQIDIMFNSQIFQAFHDLLRLQKRVIFFLRRSHGIAVQLRMDSQTEQIIFKILQFRVYFPITMGFRLIHIIQLA